MTRLTTAPVFADIDPNSPEFRKVLSKAMEILVSHETRFGVYSHHSHDEVKVGLSEVVFEQKDGDQLRLCVLDEAKAAELGKPSCWAFLPGDGSAEVVVLRYAEKALHDAAEIDVASAEFQAELQEVADAFVAAGIHKAVELNISAGYLFVPPAGFVTREDTVAQGLQTLRFVEPPADILAGDKEGLAACWVADAKGEPVVMGWCTTDHRSGKKAGA